MYENCHKTRSEVYEGSPLGEVVVGMAVKKLFSLWIILMKTIPGAQILQTCFVCYVRSRKEPETLRDHFRMPFGKPLEQRQPIAETIRCQRWRGFWSVQMLRKSYINQTSVVS